MVDIAETNPIEEADEPPGYPVAEAEIEIRVEARHHLFGVAPHLFDDHLLRDVALGGGLRRSLKHLFVVD